MRCGKPYGLLVGMAWALVAAPPVWANSAPVVSNVTASQRSDGTRKVDIHYDLADADGDACSIWVQVSNNGGQTWAVPAQTFTGAIGSGITPGTGKLIVWDCLADLPGQTGTLQVRVCANDGQSIPSGMAPIPAGEFQMGDTFATGQTYETPVHAVYVSSFYMDQKLVTNQQYVDALNWAKAQGNLISVTSGVVYNAAGTFAYCATTTGEGGVQSRITWDGSTFAVIAGRENYPMYLVSFYGSAAYANWRSAMQGKPLCYNTSTWSCNYAVSGYRLPSEAEWEKAARGGAAGHRFPWSDTDTIQHARANYSSNANIAYDTSPTRGYHPAFSDDYPYVNPVGYFAPNGYGLYDMAGNVWERVNDFFSDTYYSTSPYNNPTGPPTGTNIVVRGGSWHAGGGAAQCATRSDGIGPNYRAINIGFRLVLAGSAGGSSGEGCADSATFSFDNFIINADLDLDLDVDIDDFSILQKCFTPIGQTVAAGCEGADLDHDQIVDQGDFVLFLRCLNGANQPPGCN